MSGLGLLSTNKNSAAFRPGYAPTDIVDTTKASFGNVRQNFTTDAEIRLIGDPLNERNAQIQQRLGKSVFELTGTDKKYTNPTPEGRIQQLQESNGLIDQQILIGRKENPALFDGIKTTAEIEEEGKTVAQDAMKTAGDIAQRNPSDLSRISGQLIGGIGGAFTDPVNIATLPIGAGEAKIVGTGAFAVAKGVTIAAAKEGAIQAAIEAASVPQIAQWQNQLGHKYGLAEATTDVAFGFLGGAGIRAGMEGIAPAFRGVKSGAEHVSSYVLDSIATKSPKLAQTVKDSLKYMARTAYVDDAAPAPISKIEDLQAHRQATQKTADDIEAYRRPAPEIPNASKIITPRNELELDVVARVVELEQLITSDRAEFDQSLQPRDRSNRVASAVRIQEIAARLDPAQLGDSRVSNTGSPIVGQDMMVESGNGRAMALREAYANHPENAQRYREYLESQGHSTKGFKNPVLIRQRVSPLTPAQRKDFVIFSNEDVADRLSTTERALADAKLVTNSNLGQYRGGDIDNAVNANFVREFIDSVVSPAERNAFLTPGGKLSQDGAKRIRAALLAKAYSDAGLVQRLLEDGDNDIKTIGKVLMDLAGDWTKMRAAIADGDTPPQYDITADLMDAVNTIINARSDNRPITDYLNQKGLFAETDMTAETNVILRGMYKDDLSRPLGYDKVKEFLGFYVREVGKIQGGPDLLGSKPIEPIEILEKSLERLHGKELTAELALDRGGSPEIAAVRSAGLEDLVKNIKHPATGQPFYKALEDMASRPETIKDKALMKSKERKALHAKIIKELDDEQRAKSGGEFTAGKTIEIVMGPPGAGKSAVLATRLQRDLRAVVIDSDMIKEKMPEFDNGIGANAVHEESKVINKERLIDAMSQDFNIIYPVVGHNSDKIATEIDEFIAAGYTVNVRLVQIPANESLKRAIVRFGEEGRLVPPSYVMSIGDKPIKTFDLVKQRDDINAYSYFDNNVKKGQEPRIVESNDPRYVAREETRNGTQGTGERGTAAQAEGDPGAEGLNKFFDDNAYRLSEYREPRMTPPTEIKPSDRFEASRASFDSLAKENPDMLVTLDDGSSVSLAAYADKLKASDGIIEALTTCRLA